MYLSGVSTQATFGLSFRIAHIEFADPIIRLRKVFMVEMHVPRSAPNRVGNGSTDENEKFYI
jgi:hypothetical protein